MHTVDYIRANAFPRIESEIGKKIPICKGLSLIRAHCTTKQDRFLPVLLHKLVGELFWIFCREILREIWRELSGIFSDPQNKGQTLSGILRAFFVRTFASQ